MAQRKVIVFGPTGAVGSSVARTAAELGAKVVLAMRDTSKAIPGLDVAAEKAGGFERVEADLTKPESVQAAINKTDAKHAFFYGAWGMPDGMAPTIEAFKAAGIDDLVFLSSFTVHGDPAAYGPDNIIPYVHAQVEIKLTQIFGADRYVALRPGSFASNVAQYKPGLAKGEVKLLAPELTVDHIVPADIGRVGGTVLAKGPPEDGKRHLYLYGSKLMTNEETVQALAKTLGKDVKLSVATRDEAVEEYEAMGRPKHLAEYQADNLIKAQGAGEQLHLFGYPLELDDFYNVERYSGKRATTFEEWAQENTEVFS